MRNYLKIGRVVAFLLLAVMISSVFTACGSRKGKTLMTLEGSSLTVNEYQLLLSRTKGDLARVYGTSVLTDSFWDTTIELNGTTYNDFFTAQVLENAKAYLTALYLFEEKDLTLPKETLDKIDEEMEGLLVGDGNGSKSELNQILSAYGVNYNILREFYVTEAKMDYLRTYLYGANGSKISDSVKDEFMTANYVRFRQIFLPNFEYVYETDAYGQIIYFSKDGKSYVYDTENGITMTDKNGKIIVDKFGDEVYFGEDEKPIYDTKKGTPMPVIGSDGNYKTEDFSKEEIEKIKSQINLLYSQIDQGDFEDFEDLMDEYSEDDSEVRDYYLEKGTESSYEYVNDIRDALLEMEIGETRIVESKSGFHLIMKYECESGAYNNEDVSVWFSNFISLLTSELFYNETKKYESKIEINSELLDGLDVKSVTHNYYY